MIDIIGGKTAPVGVSQLFNWKDDVLPGGTTLAAHPSAGAESVFRALESDLPLCRAHRGAEQRRLADLTNDLGLRFFTVNLRLGIRGVDLSRRITGCRSATSP
ncbi:hypothetical protein [Streptomyces sp. RKAG293]|uniref:hypothetical protein n=1 Tax=Streptomyces sp. RKAG293 TaxID=2893403 RepID=UPI0020340ABA|nr:hypothetical protein [Streptomyces sp. RKAG293]MCM2416796.1 hypothetical protein [Streptomyces sp. RKAG293]